MLCYGDFSTIVKKPPFEGGFLYRLTASHNLKVSRQIWWNFLPPENLRRHAISYVTPQRAAGRGDRDRTGCRSWGNDSGQVRVRFDREGCPSSVERNGSRSGEALAENANRLPNPPCVDQKFDKGGKPQVQAEDRASLIDSAILGYSVELAVGILNQPLLHP